MRTINPSTSLRVNGERSRTINPSTSLRVNGERSRTIKFYTLGCKVNQYDTQSIREKFLQAGFQELEDSQPADIYIINTCTVTQHADSDSFGLVRRAKRENPQAKLIVTGCLTELDADKIKNIDEEILIAKNKDKNKIIERLNTQQPITRNLELITYFKGHTRAFLKVQDGCDNFCSYCKVPLVRGRSRSRGLKEIIQEANQLVKNEYKEIVLSGICLGSYGKDLNPNLSLIDIIKALEEIDGLIRIRFSSIEANDISESLIDKIARSKKVCQHLHIPLQSADDGILKKMNRKYYRADYLNLIKRIKEQIPDIAITTDVLVGFPSETETNFKNTIDLIKEILPLKVHIFPYSERERTPAFGCKDKIDQATIRQRIVLLKDIASTCALTYKKQFLNKKLAVLIEDNLKANPSLWQGYTDNYIKVKVKSGQNLRNQLILVKLIKLTKDPIFADFVPKSP